MSGFTHPEVVDGRRLWMDGSMRDLIHRVRFGDPLLGTGGRRANRLQELLTEPEGAVRAVAARGTITISSGCAVHAGDGLPGRADHPCVDPVGWAAAGYGAGR